MEFLSQLYWGKDIPEEYYPEIRKSIERGFAKKEYQVITLCKGADQLEIYSGAASLKHGFRYDDKTVAGIASTREEALEIVRQITEECFQKRGDADLKTFLKDRGV
jgi:hypothetical protein